MKRLLLALLVLAGVVQASCSGYGFYKDVTPAIGYNLTNGYQHELNVTFDAGYMYPNFTSICFTNSTNDATMWHHVQYFINGTWAKVFVKGDSAAQSSTLNQTIRMYYDTSHGDTGNENKTYDLYEHFFGSSINASRFSTWGTPYVGSSVVGLDYAGAKYAYRYDTAQASDFAVDLFSANITKGFSFIYDGAAANGATGGDARTIALYTSTGVAPDQNTWTVSLNGLTTFNRTAMPSSDLQVFNETIVYANGRMKAWYNNTLFVDESTARANNYYIKITHGFISASKSGVDLMIVRRGAWPAPTYSFGARTMVTNFYSLPISYPANSTYLVSSINGTFLFTSAYPTANCTRWLDNIVQNSSIVGNNSVTIDNLTVTTPKSYNYSVSCTNSTDAISSSQYFTTSNYNITSTTYASSAYELTYANHSTAITVAAGFSLSGATLWWNASSYAGTCAAGTCSASLLVPLIPANNTNVTFNWVYSLVYPNTTVFTVNGSAYNQSLYYSVYGPALTTDAIYLLEYQNSTATISATAQSALPTLTATFSLYYSNGTLQASYSSASPSWAGSTVTWSSSQNLGQANLSVTENRTWASTLNVSYGSVQRIMTLTNATVNVSRLVLTNCSTASVSQTSALQMFLVDEDSSAYIYNGTIDANFDVWTAYSTGSVTRNYPFTFALTGTTNQSVCIFPTWASFSANMSAQYSAPGYSTRTYYLSSAALSNASTTLNLYLGNSSLSGQTVIYVKDTNGAKVTGAVVKVQRYFFALAAYQTVTMVTTDEMDGKGVTYLETNTVYYRFVIEQGGVVVTTVASAPIVCTTGSCPPYVITLTMNPQALPDYVQQIGTLTYGCVWTNATSTLICSTNDGSGLAANTTLSVVKFGTLTNTQECWSQCATTACTFSCVIANTTGYRYFYSLNMKTSNGNWLLLSQGYIDEMSGLFSWGLTGLLLALFMVLVFFAMGNWNPTAALVMSFCGIVAGFVLGMLPVSVGSLIGLGCVIAILAYRSRT